MNIQYFYNLFKYLKLLHIMSSINHEINTTESIIKYMFEQIILLNNRIDTLEKQITNKETIPIIQNNQKKIDFSNVDWNQVHYY